MVTPAHLLGVVLALGAAVAGASNRLFVRAGTEGGTAAEAFFVVITVSTLVVVPLVAVGYYPHYRITPASLLWFVLAGLAGSLLGNFWLYSSIERIGASRTQPFIAANALVATALSFVFLGESITPAHAIGVAMIVGGIATIAWETTRGRGGEGSRRHRATSLLLPLGAAVAFGTEPILANLGFAQGTPAPVGLAIKVLVAWLGFSAVFVARGRLPPVSLLRTSDGRWFVLAGVAYVLFMLGYYVGLVLAPVNVVTPMIITNTLFVIVLSAIFMPRRLERVTWKLVVAATFVVAGALVVTLAG